MILGALFDLGVPPSTVRKALAALDLPRWGWKVSRVRRGAFIGTRVAVAAEPSRGSHGRHGLIARVLRRAPRSGLPPSVIRRGCGALRALLAAEGRVHGVRVEHAHLHEVEDLDTIVDIFGSLIALDRLGVDRVWVSPVTAGSGTVHAAHGELPVPAPGTAELLRGRTVRLGEGGGELVTPTGAALLSALAESGQPPELTMLRIGYGAGARDTAPRPNLLRAFLATVDGERTGHELRQLEALVDDASPQLVEAFQERAYREGALEAWTVAVQAKRSRPAAMMCALVEPERVEALLRVFFEETGSLGVRAFPVTRHALARRLVRVRTRWGPLTVKVAGRGATLHVIPEWREVKALAARRGIPARLILEEARGAWRRFAGH